MKLSMFPVMVILVSLAIPAGAAERHMMQQLVPADKLAEVLVNQAITPTPVPTDTPTITPTPDLRSQETIFADAQQKFINKNHNRQNGYGLKEH